MMYTIATMKNYLFCLWGIWNRYCSYIYEMIVLSVPSDSFIQDEDGGLKLKHLQTEWVNTKRTYRGRERKKIKEENKRRREYWPALGQIKATING
jgi:hypothetical protein